MANLRAQLLNKPAVVRGDLKDCPFCGSPPEIEYWHGGRLTKRMISCSNYDCDVKPSVTGDTEHEAIAAWNTRATASFEGDAVERVARVISRAMLDNPTGGTSEERAAKRRAIASEYAAAYVADCATGLVPDEAAMLQENVRYQESWLKTYRADIKALEKQIENTPDEAEPVPADPLDDLVARFSAALLEKLKAAREKYGYGDEGWRDDDWMDECQIKLLSHLAKGDPRDVAAYCAFMWHHGWSTIAPDDELNGCVARRCAKQPSRMRRTRPRYPT